MSSEQMKLSPLFKCPSDSLWRNCIKISTSEKTIVTEFDA